MAAPPPSRHVLLNIAIVGGTTFLGVQMPTVLSTRAGAATPSCTIASVPIGIP